MSIENINILKKTGALVAEKLRDTGITLHNYQQIKAGDGHNYYFNTEVGAFIIKGEKMFWYKAGRDSRNFHEPTVTINASVCRLWIKKYKATFLYHCEPYGDVIKYLDFETMKKKEVVDIQPWNKEVVVGFPERIFQPWTPKREYISYF